MHEKHYDWPFNQLKLTRTAVKGKTDIQLKLLPYSPSNSK